MVQNDFENLVNPAEGLPDANAPKIPANNIVIPPDNTAPPQCRGKTHFSDVSYLC